MAKHFWRLLPFIGCMLSWYIVTPAHAQPLTTDCETNQCYTHQIWGFQSRYPQHGGQTQFTVDNPPIHDSNDYYYKDIIVANYNDLGAAEVGITKNGYCGSTLSYFTYVVNSSGNQIGGYNCTAVPSGDINQLVTFQCSYYVTNGPGTFCYWSSLNRQQTFYFKGADTVYDFIDLEVSVRDDSITGHDVWGGEWVDNQWQSIGTGTPWEFQNSDCSGGTPGDAHNLCITFGYHYVPQMTWDIDADGQSNDGGILYSCVYDSTSNSCTFGS